MKFNNHRILLLTIISLIFFIPLFKQGMFMDGLIYSCVSRNLSDNFLCHNHLFLSTSFLSNFHEQPPLAFYIQGIFIKFFGDSYFVDRLYSFFCFVSCIFILNAISREFTVLKKYSIIAIVFFMFIPVVDWSFKNNMLENTMCIFTLLSIYISFKYYHNQSFSLFTFAFINGIIIVGAFLTKGFTGIFTLSFPFIFQLVQHRKKNGWLLETSLIILSCLIIIYLSFILFPSIKIYIFEYLNTQVIASVKGNREVDGYFFIVKRIPQELLILIIITFLLHLKYKAQILFVLLEKLKTNRQLIFVFLLALSGSLPIMVSPKQSGYYVLCSYPLFALFFAILNFNEIIELFRMPFIISKSKIIRFSLLFLFIISCTLMLYNIGKYYRDEEKIKMVDQISNIVKGTTDINISSELNEDYSLYGYFARRHKINLFPAYLTKSNNKFLLTKTLDKSYKIVKTFSLNNEKYF